MNAYDKFEELTCRELEKLTGSLNNTGNYSQENVRDITPDNVSENAQRIFASIAKNLFNHFYIQKGDVVFHFLEIEFYYYSDVHQDNNSKNLTPFVYKRKCNTPGALMIHSSGVDICFRSKYKENKPEEMTSWGGILIRSMLRIEKISPAGQEYSEDKAFGNKGVRKQIVAGPWDCCDALFDYSMPGNYPELKYSEKEYEINVCKTIRHNASQSTMMNAEYCFYDSEIEEYWKLERINPAMLTVQKNQYTAKSFTRKGIK